MSSNVLPWAQGPRPKPLPATLEHSLITATAECVWSHRHPPAVGFEVSSTLSITKCTLFPKQTPSRLVPLPPPKRPGPGHHFAVLTSGWLDGHSRKECLVQQSLAGGNERVGTAD